MSLTAPFQPMIQGVRRARAWPPPDRLSIYALVSSASFVAYVLARIVEGPASQLFAAFGVSACGWAWLLTRALFNPARRDVLWPRLVVGTIAVTGAIGALAPAGMIQTVASNIYDLGGSAALVLTLIEPFQRHACAMPHAEIRFRTLFVCGFALLAGLSVLGFWLDPAPIQVGSAIVSLLAVMVIVAWRRANPLQPVPSKASAPRPVTPEDTELAARLSNLLEKDAIYANPDLRIGDAAARLNVPEHRVSRAVSALGFANFNRLINHHRIALAKDMFARPEPASILQIALDCGFGSVGPFNRAFKQETGLTPRAYRAAIWTPDSD